MAVISKDLGAVTAYAAAVNRGYTGTKEEFETLMASYATVAQQAAESAGNASQSAQSASQSATDAETAKGTAQQAATDAQSAQASAQESAQSAQASAQSAQGYAQSAESAKDTAVNAVDGFAAGAQQALDSVNSAGNNWKSLAQAQKLDAEAWAVGKRDGADVGSSDETYHNNAKYYAESASASAQTATEAAQTATQKASDAQASAEAAAESAASLVVDTEPTEGSTHAVSSGAVYGLKENLTSIATEVNGVHISTELYDKSTNRSNGCLRADGTIRSSSNYVITDFIPLQSGYAYEYTGLFVGHSYAYTCFYNSEKVIMPDYSICAYGQSEDMAYTLSVPEGAAYVKFSIFSGESHTSVDDFSILKKFNQDGIADHVEYLNVLGSLKGKQALFFGDSVCNGSSAGDNMDGWAGRIGRTYKMDWHNYGYNGATITAIEGHHCISSDVATAINVYPDADYIILEGGTNDADNLYTEGVGTYDPNDYSGAYDTATFSGALETMLYNAVTTWKTAQIGFIVAHKMGTGQTGRDRRYAFFTQAMLICKKWGIPVLNLWDESKLNPLISTHYDNTKTAQENISAGNLYTDGQHLTPTGYDTLLPFIAGWMRTL